MIKAVPTKNQAEQFRGRYLEQQPDERYCTLWSCYHYTEQNAVTESAGHVV
jgi:hypothetical protein